MGTALLDVVEGRLPGWRTRCPRRALAVGWRLRAVAHHGRQLEVFALPVIGTTWVVRGGRYWVRRVGVTVVLVVAVAVTASLDVGCAVAASSSPVDLVALVVVLAVLFATTSLLYWRADLFARRGVAGTAPLPGPVKAVGVVVGGFGLVLTPGYVLGMLLDLLPRFPVQERVAWQYRAFRLAE